MNAYPLAGLDARKHRDEGVLYTRAEQTSQEENTLRVLMSACGKSCGKI